MAVDPKLLVVKQVDELPSKLNPSNNDEFLIYDGTDLKKSKWSNIESKIKTGIKGTATQANAPTAYTPEAYPNGLFETYVVRTPLTLPNSWGSAVTQAELDVNSVYFDVKNGVVSKEVSLKPKGLDGKTIEDWSAKVYVIGSSVYYNGKIFYNPTTITDSGDVPGTSSKWKERVSSNLKLPEIYNEKGFAKSGDLPPTSSLKNDAYKVDGDLQTEYTVFGKVDMGVQILVYNGTDWEQKYPYQLKNTWHTRGENQFHYRYGWGRVLECIQDAYIEKPKNNTNYYQLDKFQLLAGKISFAKLVYNSSNNTFATFILDDINFNFSTKTGVRLVKFEIEPNVFVSLKIDFDTLKNILQYDYEFSAGENDLLRNTYISDVRNYVSKGNSIAASNYKGSDYELIATGLNDHIIINQMINNVASQGGGTIYLSDGQFNLGGSIIMMDNVHLQCSPKTIVRLANGASAYLVTNSKTSAADGNKNISIDGGIWDGNKGGGQTRNYTGNPLETYWGFGFLFKEVDGLKMTNMKIIETEAWGVAPFRIKNAEFRNIEFAQSPQVGTNGDGITGFSWQNVIIDNIWGYTNDDLIGVCCANRFGGSLGGNEIYWADDGFESKNISITNLTSMKHQYTGDYCHRLIGIYSTGNVLIDNLNISGLKGGWSAYGYAIGFIQYWPDAVNFDGKSNLGSIDISNIDLEATHANPTLIAFSNREYLQCKNLNINNVKMTANTINNFNVLEIMGGVAEVNINNVMAVNKGSGNIYPVRVSKNVGTENTNASVFGIHKTSKTLNFNIDSGTGLLRINTDTPINTTQINNAIDGDVVIDSNFDRKTFKGGSWV